MKIRLAAASLAVAALTSVPLSSAAPGGNGNGHQPVTPPGQTVSAVAKSGGGPVGVLTTLTGLKPYSRGLANALEHVTVNHAPPGP